MYYKILTITESYSACNVNNEIKTIGTYICWVYCKVRKYFWDLMIRFFFNWHLCLKVLMVTESTHCLAVFFSRFVLTQAKITRWWNHHFTQVLLQGKKFFAAQQDMEMSYENKKIPKILKVSQKSLRADTLTGRLLLVSHW